jgi:hypothetical protein
MMRLKMLTKDLNSSSGRSYLKRVLNTPSSTDIVPRAVAWTRTQNNATLRKSRARKVGRYKRVRRNGREVR